MSEVSVPRFDLSGRVALVTGASSGFGEHWSRLLAAAGAKVVLAARRTDRLETVAAEIRATGGAALAVPLDVCDEAATAAAYAAGEAEFGPIDTIVANAGISDDRLALELPTDSFEQIVAINLTGVFKTVREGARRLIAADRASRGRVVVVSSITAKKPYAAMTAYAASKAGVLHMSRLLAREWARKGICVNAILPGYIETEMTGDLFAEGSKGGEWLLKSFPRRALTPMTAMDAPLLFFCSDLAAHVTGAELTVDDGQSL
ncbi:SDR family NAD(P)-dependent oxidoreductase [Novosphingobium sp. Gsoil 351]|uniref:SDR family NAD(P)-dependent oxidoreductase n=1 Tax=Novosphingobium sp. Gsoil 351 TaxID=2675225 RepID=UPI0012B49193|nr:SDR family NAD(P)-dependent oxidoreductase [Novosphingobium sp. Gsoil 351]QGN55310.1 SDR family NAD(P)-dependent oxidoreductase [Novosphingobium sp. Gsoil 351]